MKVARRCAVSRALAVCQVASEETSLTPRLRLGARHVRARWSATTPTSRQHAIHFTRLCCMHTHALNLALFVLKIDAEPSGDTARDAVDINALYQTQ